MLELKGEREEALAGRFIEWVNSLELAEESAMLVVVPDDYTVITSGEGEGFACYRSPGGIIFSVSPEGMRAVLEKASGDERLSEFFADGVTPRRAFLENIAHEYMHHVQHVEGREFDEDEAERFALDTVGEFLQEAA